MTDVLATDAELEALRKAAGIPHLPTQLTFEARLAISGEGPRAYDWSDKPHRIVFDLCREIERAEAERDKAYASGYSDAETEISKSALGQRNDFLHSQYANAADHIAALTAERDRLREALQFYADASWSSLDDDLGNNGRPGVKARAALRDHDHDNG